MIIIVDIGIVIVLSNQLQNIKDGNNFKNQEKQYDQLRLIIDPLVTKLW